MPAPTPLNVLERLRALLKRFGVNESARLAGVNPMTASRVKNGQRHAKPTPRQCIKLCSLGLTKANGKLCRKCGEPMRVKTFSGLCVECEVLGLEAAGKIEIAVGQ